MMELIPTGTKIDFIGKSKYFFVLSLAMIVSAFYVWFSTGETKYGTDFSGGHEFLVSFTEPVDTEKIREALAREKLTEARVQAFQGAEREFSIRLGGATETQVVRTTVDKALQESFPGAYKIEKTDFVGPTVGKELRTSALIAIGLSLLGILIYIAFRFELSVGIGTIVALFHDVVIATGIYLACGHLITMSTLAAALTIVGYSVNDTVVVFDRVREERGRRKNVGITELVNESLNLTLSRTLITHILTLFSALSLYLIGGSDIADLALYLVAGIVLGSYSTIFIASPIAILWEKWRGTANESVVSRGTAKAA